MGSVIDYANALSLVLVALAVEHRALIDVVNRQTALLEESSRAIESLIAVIDVMEEHLNV